MKPSYYIASILSVLLMAGCRHVSQMNLLTEAESFLPAEPDSADVRLKMVDTRLLEGDEEESAYYALLRTMTDAMQGATSPNDTLVNRAYNFYRQKSKDGTSSDHALVKYFAQSAMYMGDLYAAHDSVKASEAIERLSSIRRRLEIGILAILHIVASQNNLIWRIPPKRWT